MPVVPCPLMNCGSEHELRTSRNRSRTPFINCDTWGASTVFFRGPTAQAWLENGDNGGASRRAPRGRPAQRGRRCPVCGVTPDPGDPPHRHIQDRANPDVIETWGSGSPEPEEDEEDELAIKCDCGLALEIPPGFYTNPSLLECPRCETKYTAAEVVELLGGS